MAGLRILEPLTPRRPAALPRLRLLDPIPSNPAQSPAPQLRLLEPLAPAEDQPGRLASLGSAVAQEAASVIADVPKSIAISRSQGEQATLNAVNAFQRGEPLTSEMLTGVPFSVRPAFLELQRNHEDPEAVSRSLNAIRDLVGVEPGGTFALPQESIFFQAGESLAKGAREAFPTNPEFEDDISTKLARGVGSGAGFLAAAALTRGAKLPASLGAATTGAAVGATNQFQDAINSGATIEDAFKAANLSAIVGTSEAIPIAQVLNRFDKFSGGTLKRIIKEGLKGGVEEGLQEVFQQISDGLIASKIVAFDPERNLFQGTGEAAGIGFSVGTLFNVVAAMFGVRSRNRQGARQDTINANQQAVDALDPSQAQLRLIEPIQTPTAQPEADVIGETTTQQTATLGEQLRVSVAEDGRAVILPSMTQEDTGGFPSSVAVADEVTASVVGQEPVTELTPEGEQVLAPGIEPITAAGRIRERAARGLAPTAEQVEPGALFEEPQADLVTDLQQREAQERAAQPGSIEDMINRLRPGGPVVALPQTLIQFIRQQGGINASEAKDLSALGIDARSLPALVNRRGKDLDALGEAATEAGFFADRPTPRKILDALDQEFNQGQPTFKRQDQDLALQNDQLDQLAEEIDRRGIDLGLSNAAIVAQLNRPFTETGLTAMRGIKAVASRAKQALGARPGDPIGAFTTTENAPGAEFVGFRQDQLTAGAEQATEPVTRETVLRPLLEALNIPIYFGRVRGQRLGFFRKPVEEVRSKVRGDLEIATHEVAHLLDFRIPELGKAYRSRAFRNEIRGVSYDKKKLNEGFAEFVRLWMTQPEQVQKRAPRFTKWFEQFLDRNELGPVIRQSREAAGQFFAQSSLDRARSKFGPPALLDDFLATPRERFRQAVLDDLDGIRRAELTLTGEVSHNGIYETARRSRAAAHLVEGALKFGVPKFEPFEGTQRITFVDKRGQPSVRLAKTKTGAKAVPNPRYRQWGFAEILRPVSDDLEAFGLYAVGQRAAFLKDQGRENLFKSDEIKAMQALETDERAQAFEDWNRFNSQVLNFAEQGNIIDPEQRASWETNVYVPFYRQDTRKAPTGPVGRATGNLKIIQRLRGGTANLRDPIANMFGNTRFLIEAAVINDARLKVIDEISRAQGGARFLVKIPRDNKSVFIDKTQVKQQFMEAVATAGEIDADTRLALEAAFDSSLGDFARFWLHNQSPSGDRVVAVMRKGKAEFYEVADPLLFRSLQAMPRRIVQDDIIRLLRTVRNIGQLTVTASVNFPLRNITRDQFMAAVLSRNGFVPFVDAAKGLRSRLTEDPNYQEWLANGGGIASFFVDEQHVSKRLEQMYQRKGIPFELVVNTPRKFVNMLRTILDATEAATRLAEFQRSLDLGSSPAHAAFESREISSDFAMRGDSKTLAFFYDSVMFLKAGVIGMDRVYRGFTQGENKAEVATKTGTLALLSIGLYALNRGNPLYDELEDWDRDSAWHFFIVKPEAHQEYLRTGKVPDLAPDQLYHHFRLMKPWEIGGLSSIAERSVEGVIDQDPSQALKILNIIRNQFRLEFLPQAFVPIYELATNRLLFFDRPIETRAVESLQPFARATPGTSRTLRAAGEATRALPRKLQLNPVRTEALLRGYFNTWAAYGFMLSDAMFFDDIPELRASQYPGIGVFFRDGPARSTRFTTEFYDMLREATETRRTMRLMDRTNRPEIADELEFARQNLQYNQLSKAAQTMTAFSREMKAITFATDLQATQAIATEMARDPGLRAAVRRIRVSTAWNDTGALKRDLMDIWLRQRNAFVREVVKDVEAQTGEPAPLPRTAN